MLRVVAGNSIDDGPALRNTALAVYIGIPILCFPSSTSLAISP